MSASHGHTLDQIKAPVDQEIREFSGFFKNAMRSNVKLLDTVARYIVKQKGKRIRPVVVFLCAKACGTVNPSTFRGATLVEILHTATLVHDDVVDDADTRRGLASINAVWKNKVAVLMGDYLLSTGLMISLKHDDVYFLRVTSDSVRRMSEGEMLQIQKSRELNIDEETYLTIISNKTASLLSTCSEIGAASVTEDPAVRKAMKEFGENVGMAFQIRDDILDFTSRKSILGKPIGGDLREKKITLPLIHALKKAPSSDAKAVLKKIKKGVTDDDVLEIIEFVRKNEGISYAEQRAYEYGEAARKCLAPLTDSDAKRSLEWFIDFVMEREK